MEITSERVEIPVDGGRMPAFLARPAAGGPHPAVIVYMEIFGVNSHIRDVTERVAREGYVAVAPNYFWRTAADLDLGYDEAGFQEGFAHMQRLRAEEMVADARAVLRWLRQGENVRGDRVGCMGFCIGGHMAYLTACETDVAATASFYGGGIAGPEGPGGAPSTLERTGKIRGRILCFFGEKDSFIPLDQVERIKAALNEHEVRYEVVVYDEADHGFFCDQRGSHDREAAGDAWKRTLRLFAEELQG